MDIVNYVNKVGELINYHTKYSVKLDRTSIENTVILPHLDELLTRVKADTKLTEEQKEEAISKLTGYINCLKKEINFYPEKLIDTDCILTEVEEHIIQE